MFCFLCDITWFDLGRVRGLRAGSIANPQKENSEETLIVYGNSGAMLYVVRSNDEVCAFFLTGITVHSRLDTHCTQLLTLFTGKYIYIFVVVVPAVMQ